MSIVRDKTWYLLHDKGGEITQIEADLDLLDLEIWDGQYLLYQETKARLERLGVNTANYGPPPRPARAEQRSRNHITKTDDVEHLVQQAKRTAARERDAGVLHRNTGKVLRVR